MFFSVDSRGLRLPRNDATSALGLRIGKPGNAAPYAAITAALSIPLLEFIVPSAFKRRKCDTHDSDIWDSYCSVPFSYTSICYVVYMFDILLNVT